MPRYAANKSPATVKRRYFELIRQGLSGAEAARRVGVSLSCGSLWFIDAGSVSIIETTPISARYRMRLIMLVGLPNGHTAPLVGDALVKAFSRLPAPMRRTLTWDQGNEMFHHPRIEHETGLRIYFADPHSPWQRGSNENANSLLRQYFPKGTDLDVWSTEQLDLVAAEINDRPRLCLDDLSPAQPMRRWERRFARTPIRFVR